MQEEDMRSLRAQIAVMETPWLVRASQQASGLLWYSCAPQWLSGAQQKKMGPSGEEIPNQTIQEPALMNQPPVSVAAVRTLSGAS